MSQAGVSCGESPVTWTEIDNHTGSQERDESKEKCGNKGKTTKMIVKDSK